MIQSTNVILYSQFISCRIGLTSPHLSICPSPPLCKYHHSTLGLRTLHCSCLPGVFPLTRSSLPLFTMSHRVDIHLLFWMKTIPLCLCVCTTLLCIYIILSSPISQFWVLGCFFLCYFDCYCNKHINEDIPLIN